PIERDYSFPLNPLSHQLQRFCERIGREEKEPNSPCRLTEALDQRKIFRSRSFLFRADGIKRYAS
ncbi:unnamed protein product, partial [Musa textilis]